MDVRAGMGFYELSWGSIGGIKGIFAGLLRLSEPLAQRERDSSPCSYPIT